MMRTLRRILSTVLLLSGTTLPAAAQEIDFSGSWVPIYHEDGPERLPA